MSESGKLRFQRVTEFWYQPDDEAGHSGLCYRPAVLVESTLNYRSLRAGLNHSEEHNYTAWLPPRDLAIDWDTPAIVFDDASRLASHPHSSVVTPDDERSVTESELLQYEKDLVDLLVRNERLRLYFSPAFGLYSAPGETLESFLARSAEAALARTLPELKKLRYTFELQLEQIREAQLRKVAPVERFSPERLELRYMSFLDNDSPLAMMFLNLAESVFETIEPRHGEETSEQLERREDLERVQGEAAVALRALYDEYLDLANEHDVFEIGLQPKNVQVRRRALLWVPVRGVEPT